MLKALHKYRIIFLVIIVFASFALALSGFVQNFFVPQRQAQAIEVNGEPISYERYQQARREMEQLYRSIYGPNYFQVLQSQGISLQNQVVDKLIDQTALRQAAKKVGLAVSEDTLRREIQSQLGGTASVEQYRYLLSQLGMTAQQFENQIREAVLLTQLRQIVTDANLPSQAETKAALIKNRTEYAVTTVSIDPARYESQMPEPSDEEVSMYYEENSSDFEVPARISYNFAVLDPEKFLDLVEVTDDDIEFYYADNESSYMKPERVRAKAIQIGIQDEKSTPTPIEIEIRKKRAEEALDRLHKGESIEALSKELSTDLDLSQLQGELGVLTQAQLQERFGEDVAEAVFALAPNENSGVLEKDGVFVIVKVEEKFEAAPRPLAEVRQQIEQLIREREAPAYAADQAVTLYDRWSRSDKSLADFMRDEKLTDRGIVLASTSGFLPAGEDPAGLTGLTAYALENPEEKKQLADLPEHTVLLEVTDAHEPEIRPLAEVSEQIKTVLKRRAAQEKAANVAEELRNLVIEGTAASLSDAARKEGLEPKEDTKVTRAGAEGVLANEHVRRALFATTQAGAVSPEVYAVNGQRVVFQVTGITPPSTEEIESGMLEATARQTIVVSQLALESLVKKFRQNAEVEVEPGLVG